MRVENEICYAGNDLEDKKVENAVALKGGMLLVTFTNGEKKLFDTTLLKGSAFEPLKDEEVFKNIEIFHGIITWLDGTIDIAPETVHDMGYPYERDSLY